MDNQSNGEGILIASFSLYIQACTHRSFSREYNGKHNERLEFIGDSVLQLLVTELLLSQFPEESEGSLSQMRHKLVNNQFLAEAARNLKLGALIRLGKGEERTGGRDRDRILANTFEACLGAVYLDKGLEQARKIVYHHIKPALMDSMKKSDKQRLHEWCQQTYHMAPIYKELKRWGPAHQLRFRVVVVINHKNIAEGEGFSFKKATRQAAETAIQKLGIQ